MHPGQSSNNMSNENIKEIARKQILTLLDRSFFDDMTHTTASNEKVEIALEEFTQLYPSFNIELYEFLIKSFPNAVITDCTQFYTLDRCVRFIVEIDSNERLVCQYSILGYFCIYKIPLPEKLEDILKNILLETKIHFFDPNTSSIADKIYEFEYKKLSFIWLHTQILEENVKELSIIPNGANDLYHYVTFADALFTEHYF